MGVTLLTIQTAQNSKLLSLDLSANHREWDLFDGDSERRQADICFWDESDSDPSVPTRDVIYKKACPPSRQLSIVIRQRKNAFVI